VAPSRLQLLTITTALWGGGDFAIASPGHPPGPCTATEKYSWPDGDRADIGADNEFEDESGSSKLDRAAGTLKQSLVHCAGDVDAPILGRVVIRFQIDPDGGTTGANITGPTDRKLRECGIAAIARLHIPHHPTQVAADPIDVACPFDFGPHVSIGEITAATLDPLIVKRHLKRIRNKLDDCDLDRHGAARYLGGAVIARFTIATDGRVTRSDARGLSPPVNRCVAATIRGMEFTHPQSSVEVTAALSFAPAR
jgi:hypothetical protein